MRRLFQNCRIIDGLGGVLEHGWVLVRDGGIEATGGGAPEAASGREGVEVEDLGGKTLMPGLIDCHVHLVLDGSADPMGRAAEAADAEAVLKMAANGLKTLKAGFTTVRDLGSKNHIDIHLRNAVEAGLTPGPRIACAGRMICITGGHGNLLACVADGPDEVRKAVRAQAAAGVDWVKLMATGGVPGMPHYSPDELRAGVEEAHKLNLRTAAHSQSLEGSRNCVRAGIDTVEHGVGLDRELVDDMARKGTFLVPTFSAPVNIRKKGEAAGIPAEFVEKSKRLFDKHVAGFELALGAGVKIAMGTDAGTPFNLHGENAGEIVLMAEYGLSADQAIRSATSRAAELLGMAETTGSIAPGRRADILVVDGDPLADLSILADPSNIHSVYRAGVLVNR